MFEYTIIKTGQEAREALKRGADVVADIVKTTLGNKGRNVIFEKHGKVPRITNDGVSIAREIILKDEIEDLGAQTIVEIATKTNEMVGDGTTTSIVLGQAIITEGYKRTDSSSSLVGGGADPMTIRKQISEGCDEVVAKLKEMAKPVKTLQEKESVAISAVEDPAIGKIIAKMVDEIGADGYIAVDDSYGYETVTEVINGMKFYGEYAADFMITNNRKEAEMAESHILVTNIEIEEPQQIQGICEMLLQLEKVRKLVIIAPKYTSKVLAAIYNTQKVGGFRVLGIKTPALTDAQLEDIALYTGAVFIDKTKQDKKLENVQILDLGKINRAIVDKDDAILIDGNGDQKEVTKRIKELRENIKVEKIPDWKEKTERRIASLAGKVGVIKVGSKTESEKHYLRMKIEDAVHATQAAVEEGIVPGGGLAFKKISASLPDGHILKEALLAPNKQIEKNAGGKIEIGKNVIDPVKVSRTALENACSLAGTFITTSSAIAWKRYDLAEVMRETMKEKL